MCASANFNCNSAVLSKMLNAGTQKQSFLCFVLLYGSRSFVLILIVFCSQQEYLSEMVCLLLLFFFWSRQIYNGFLIYSINILPFFKNMYVCHNYACIFHVSIHGCAFIYLKQLLNSSFTVNYGCFTLYKNIEMQNVKNLSY